MDLKRITAWTRDELDEEARKRGIDGAETLEREDLVAQVLAHEKRSTASVVDAARSILGRVVDMALGARRPEDRPPPSSSAPPRRSSAPPPAPASPPVEASPPAAVQPPAPMPAAPPDASDPRDARRLATTEPAPPSSPATDARPSHTEPIRTRMMARLLAEQGHPARARAIYDELLASDPSDAELRIERDTLTSAIPQPQNAVSNGSYEFDAISTVGIDATSALLAWEITEAGVERARSVLGGAGELTLRIVTIAADAQQIVRARSVDHGPVERTGHHVANDLPPHATCFAAIGLHAGDRFVAIAHAAGVRTAPGEPVPQIATEYVRVPTAAEIFPVGAHAEPVATSAERSAEALRSSAAKVDVLTTQAASGSEVGGASELVLPSGARTAGGGSELARPSGAGRGGGASERARPSGSPPGGGTPRR